MSTGRGTALNDWGSLLGEAPPSPAGPAPDDGAPFELPPALELPRSLTALRFSLRQLAFTCRARRELGETFALRFPRRLRFGDDRTNFVTHPDHVRSLFTAPELAISTADESVLRPILGPDSVLTSVGPRHMRQRKLLLPSFHGEAIERYTAMIRDVTEREIDTLPVGRPFALAPHIQSITLDVIMAGIFGIEGRPVRGTPEHGLRHGVVRLSRLATMAIGQIAEFTIVGRQKPVGIVAGLLNQIDRHIYGVIAARRAENARDDEHIDILSLLLAARDEDGVPLTDQELRDELFTLVLAGHETTASSLAWTFERLTRNPAAYDALREAVRGDHDASAAAWIEATIQESMRNRPVIPMTGRRVQVPWQLGEYRVPAGSHVMVPITLLHHREDVYPDPFSFRPERFLGATPGPYAYVPFGGGIRRCLGATLATVEQRIVLRAVVRRTELQAADPRPERALHRNATMVPRHGACVVVTAKRPA